MSYSWTPSWPSDGLVLAPCLQTLCAEIEASPKFSQLINLGERGDPRHAAQGTGSDHNGFVVGPPRSKYPRLGYIRAIDLGGDYRILMDLRDRLYRLCMAKDARLYPFGYLKGPDSNITSWPVGTGWHRDTGDEGHLHISVTQKDGYNPSAAGWVPALDSREPWGIDEEDDMPLSDADAEKVVDALLKRKITARDGTTATVAQFLANDYILDRGPLSPEAAAEAAKKR